MPKSSAVMLQENNPDATCMSMHPAYAPGTLAMFKCSAYLEACDFCLYDDESARTLGVLDVDGWKKPF